MDKGANTHDVATKGHEPVPFTKCETKRKQEAPYEPHRTLNDQSCNSGDTSPDDHSRQGSRKKLAALVTRTRSTDSKRKANNIRATGEPLFATSHSDVGVKLPPPLPKT